VALSDPSVADVPLVVAPPLADAVFVAAVADPVPPPVSDAPDDPPSPPSVPVFPGARESKLHASAITVPAIHSHRRMGSS
jgi:hypothetical protein